MNWCPALGTVLANEEVIDGKIGARRPSRSCACRCGSGCCASPPTPSGCSTTWNRSTGPKSIKEMQRELDRQERRRRGRFRVSREPERRRRSDDDPRLHHPARHALRRDLHGAGARASAGRPDHDARADARRSKQYQRGRGRKSDLERTELAKTKTGVFTGAYAINPVNDETIPIWIADYVLASYGTGAIMAVPGARRARLRVRQAVRPADRHRRDAARRVAEEDRQHASTT